MAGLAHRSLVHCQWRSAGELQPYSTRVADRASPTNRKQQKWWLYAQFIVNHSALTVSLRCVCDRGQWLHIFCRLSEEHVWRRLTPPTGGSAATERTSALADAEPPLAIVAVTLRLTSVTSIQHAVIEEPFRP